jgi:hypothetical protein
MSEPIEPVTRAFTGVRYVRVSGWELWPVRKSLDGTTWLCRWCAKPLSGNRTSYCSDVCSNELYIRATVPGARDFAIKRANGHCEDCGVNLEHLEAAFKWYEEWFRNLPRDLDRGINRGVRYRYDEHGWPVMPDRVPRSRWLQELRACLGSKPQKGDRRRWRPNRPVELGSVVPGLPSETHKGSCRTNGQATQSRFRSAGIAATGGQQ